MLADDPFVTGDQFRCNIWSNPQVGPRWHALGETPLDAASWNALAETTGEVHRAFTSSDLEPSLLPSFNAAIAAPVPGVFTDFYGNWRPASGPWIAGAVADDGGSPVADADINNDGRVDVDDLLAVLSGWGSCSGCAADTDGDGSVNVNDMLGVLNAWD